MKARKDHDGLLEDVETHQTLQFLLQLLHLFLEIFFVSWLVFLQEKKKGRKELGCEEKNNKRERKRRTNHLRVFSWDLVDGVEQNEK